MALMPLNTKVAQIVDGRQRIICKGRHGHNKSSGNHRRRHKIKALDFAVSHLGRIERSFLHFHNNFPPGVFLSSRAVRTFLR